LPSAIQTRKGIPQGNHAHGLLRGGRLALERLFPGAAEQLVARGAIDCDMANDVRFFNEGKPLARFSSDLRTLLLSRPLLEGHLRALVQELPNVQIHDGLEAVDLIVKQRVVCGVRAKKRGSVELTQRMDADLVVDASGRGSRMAGWLQTMGFESATEERVHTEIRYSSCTYRRRPEDANGARGVIVAMAPPNKRCGVVLAQEQDSWIVTLVGCLGEQPEPTHEGMIEFARGLPNPAIYELLRNAEPLSEPISFRFPYSQRRRYELLRQFPAGLVGLGDTLCSFNPSFGQGMSVAALQAVALQECLERADGPLWKQLFRRCSKIIDTPWTIAVGADLTYPEVEGKRTAIGNLIGRYVDALRRGAVHDAELGHAFLRVAQLVDEPSSLLTPRLALRTLRASMTAVPKRQVEVAQRESFAG
jgi:flavin-dependent dehydrogenase